MPGNQGNTPNIWESREFSKILGESEGDLFFNNRKFLKCLAIWKIFQIPRYLGNSPCIQSFGKFPNLIKIPPSNSYRNLRKPGEFLKFQGIWGISQNPDIWEISEIPRHLGNFPYSQAFEKFPKNQGI